MRLPDALSQHARALIASRLGLDFQERRHADLAAGLARACQNSPFPDPEDYLAWLGTIPENSPEWSRLAAHLTVGETYFFRDLACFEALEQEVLHSLIATHRAKGIPRLRLWSAGCATGEEPYSLAILLDRLLPDRSDWALTILATDISPVALTAAQQGCYREWSFRETPRWIRERYFRRKGTDTFELDPLIRRMVTFAPLNLAEDGYPALVTNTGAMDLILCRNVLMYFTREAQWAVVSRLQRALVIGGWLLASSAEASADLFRPLVPVNFPGVIFFRKEPAPAGVLTPSWPLEAISIEPPDVLPAAATWRSPVTPPAPVLTSCPEADDCPHDTASSLPDARTLADQGRLEEASRLCDAALARDRLNVDAHLLRAAICQERGDVEPAMEALRRAIYLAQDCALAHFLLGNLLFRRGKRRQGRQSMETVVSLLGPVPREEALPGGDGLTAGRLLETARAYLESP